LPRRVCTARSFNTHAAPRLHGRNYFFAHSNKSQINFLERALFMSIKNTVCAWVQPRRAMELLTGRYPQRQDGPDRQIGSF
jgi:hypothetical protein